MVYVDTSVLVALCVNEPRSPAVSQWYAACTDEMASATWCVTEFASALGIKKRTKQLSAEQGASAWQAFERLCAGDLQLLPVEPYTFHRAAVLTLDASMGLRAGDALHLASALEAKAKAMATLDDVLARNAKRMRIKPLEFWVAGGALLIAYLTHLRLKGYPKQVAHGHWSFGHGGVSGSR